MTTVSWKRAAAAATTAKRPIGYEPGSCSTRTSATASTTIVGTSTAASTAAAGGASPRFVTRASPSSWGVSGLASNDVDTIRAGRDGGGPPEDRRGSVVPDDLCAGGRGGIGRHAAFPAEARPRGARPRGARPRGARPGRAGPGGARPGRRRPASVGDRIRNPAGGVELPGRRVGRDGLVDVGVDRVV